MTRKNGKAKATGSKKKITADSEQVSEGKQRRLANLKPWQPGQSGNPKGGPRRGESWSDLIKKIGDLSGIELADYFETYRAELKKVGRVTLKEAVIIRVYLALLFEPGSGLFNALMDRAEGKLAQTVNVNWREEIIQLITEGRLTREEVAEELGPDLATELFVGASVPLVASGAVTTAGE